MGATVATQKPNNKTANMCADRAECNAHSDCADTTLQCNSRNCGPMGYPMDANKCIGVTAKQLQDGRNRSEPGTQ